MSREHAEKNTVDRAIEIEDRTREIEISLDMWDIKWWEFYGIKEAQDKIDETVGELRSELSDLLREYRG